MVRAPVRRRGLGRRYVVLPLLGVYKPIWKYDLETLEKDLSAHLVFGTATAADVLASWPTRGRTDDHRSSHKHLEATVSTTERSTESTTHEGPRRRPT